MLCYSLEDGYTVEVAFVDFEDSEPDLIVSFAIEAGDGSIASLILLRTPKLEPLLDESERGVR